MGALIWQGSPNASVTNNWDTSGDDGNLIATTNAVGRKISYTHDNLDRVTTVSFSGTAPQAGQRTYTYDADGRTTFVQNPMGTMAYTYDADGNELSVKEPSAIQGYPASLICYWYYPDGLREYLSTGPPAWAAATVSSNRSSQTAA